MRPEYLSLLLIAATANGAVPKKSGPDRVTNTSAAISSVVSTMMSQSPKPSTSIKTTTTAHPKSTLKKPEPTHSTTKKVPAKSLTSKDKTPTATIKPSTTPDKASATATKPSTTLNKAPATTAKASLAARQANAALSQNNAQTVGGYGACGIGNPVTATYPCSWGWGCSSAGQNYYQCLTSSVPITKNPAQTMGGYAGCGIGSPVTATYDCVNGWSCVSSNVYYYQCLSTTSSSAARATTAVTTTTTTSAVTTTTTTTINVAAASAASAAASAASAAASSASIIANAMSPCATQPASGYSFLPTDQSWTGFLNEATFATTANNIATPAGYNWAFAGFYASLNQAGYLFWAPVSSYNPATCASICDATAGCVGFDIYYERTPVVNPAPACPNPGMQTGIRCAFYSQHVSSASLTNVGQWRSNFTVVIAGSNGYNKIGT